VTRSRRALAALLVLLGVLATRSPAAADEPGLLERLNALRAGLADVERSIAADENDKARAIVLRLYLDEFEPIEGWWGRGGALTTPDLAAGVAAGETAFHAALATETTDFPAAIARVRAALDSIERAARAPGVVLVPEPVGASGSPGALAVPDARTPEIGGILAELERGRSAYRAGRREEALATVEHAYLEGFEPIESRLPADLVGRVERAIHLTLRPSIRQEAPVADIDTAFAGLYADLALADRHLGGGASFWFGAFNAFAIIFREGLEAVLLIGAMLAYLGRLEGGRRHQRQVFSGVLVGVFASVATWIVARTLIPVSGASRELVEGVTALLAVGVLLYVSHWLFQKTYIHDWKAYLESHLGQAVSRGSALAMVGLAFAAVYREGFETVLFYQALLFDAGAGAVLAGFVPGFLAIVAIGVGIVRLGLRLPLKRVFGVTGTVLLWLAFVFLGKGLYNLQEAGVFAARPLAWMPDHEALRQLLGLYPLAQTMVAQLAFLLILALGAVWLRASGAAPARGGASGGPTLRSRLPESLRGAARDARPDPSAG
jgi:FTR1 family protein